MAGHNVHLPGPEKYRSRTVGFQVPQAVPAAAGGNNRYFRPTPFRIRPADLQAWQGALHGNCYGSPAVEYGSYEGNRRHYRHGFPHNSDRKSTRLNSSHVAISYAVF